MEVFVFFVLSKQACLLNSGDEGLLNKHLKG